MLKQHSTLIRRGTTEVLSRDEISNASNSLTSIRGAVDARVSQLIGLSSSTHSVLPESDDWPENWCQQRIDPQTRLETFSWGIVSTISISRENDDENRVRTVQKFRCRFPDIIRGNGLELPDQSSFRGLLDRVPDAVDLGEGG